MAKLFQLARPSYPNEVSLVGTLSKLSDYLSGFKMFNPKHQECPIDLNLSVPGSCFEHLMSNAPIMKTSMPGAIH